MEWQRDGYKKHMSQLQSEIPVKSWMTQIITTHTNHSCGETGSSSHITWAIFRRVSGQASCQHCNLLSVQNISVSLTTLKYFSVEIKQGHVKFHRYYAENCTGRHQSKQTVVDGTLLHSQLSHCLGSLMQPSDNPAGLQMDVGPCALMSAFITSCSLVM